MRPQLARVLIFAVVVSCCVCWEPSPKTFELVPSYCAVADRDATDGFSAKYLHPVKKKASWSAKGLADLDMFYTRADPKRLVPPFRVSASGYGSNIGAATFTSLAFLTGVIRQHNVTSVIDIPSGDANWIFEAPETDRLEAYCGLDIVPRVAAENQNRFAHHSNKLFKTWDFADCPLPMLMRNDQSEQQPFELVHSRDVFQHMRLPRGVRALENIVQSGAGLLVATTYPRTRTNLEQSTSAGFRPINLLLPPFSLPPPAECVLSHPKIERDLTCLFFLNETFKAQWRAHHPL